jgi:UDPglucose 6-dehydrogenase
MNITVVGVGRLGLCTALCMERSGYNVLGVDMFPSYVEALNNKEYRTHEPSVMQYLTESQNFRATTSLKEGLEFSDVIFIVVHTPNGGGKNFYDHSHLNSLLVNINKQKVENKHIVVCCTVMPTYICKIGKLLIRDCPNTTLNYNPEFIAQGDIINGFEHPDIILIGEENAEAGDIIESIYHNVCKNEPDYCRLCPPTGAEIVKISINGFITTKISYANMIGDACEANGVDKNSVLHAIGGDSRIGRKYLKPGYSFGGPCFPRDTHALGMFIEQSGLNACITKATHEYNDYHVEVQAEQLLEENLDQYEFIDVVYKENTEVPIIEESAKLKIAEYIAKMGKEVVICDKQHIITEVMKEYGSTFIYKIKE